jgi:predicted Zn-dependent protease
MQFENRTPDEHVNYSIEHPLKEFAWLAGGVLGSLLIITLLVGFFAGELAARLPYRYEKALAGEMASQLVGKTPDARSAAIERELNRLAGRIAAQMPLPEGMQVTVHYQDTPELNAFATLGAHIVVYQGLLARMPDEDTLAMVLAHEMAHAQLRHPARSLGRGVAVGILLSALDSGMGRNAAGGALGATGGISLLKFSRDQERDADATALGAVAALYQHVGGAQELFRVLESAGAGSEDLRVSMLSTHPLSRERIDRIATLARERGWAADGARTPLPAVLIH